MRQYENYVQMIKSEVLTVAAKYAFEGTLSEHLLAIPKQINPGPEARFRCCVHHERAITSERLQMAMGGDKSNSNVIEVLEEACDQCPVNRYIITETCRGCLAHRCAKNCPKDAIRIEGGKAIIDYDKCVECGRCKDQCPYNAIADVMRPCKRECPTNAITIDHRKKAVIDNDKCIQCGACVYQCPFGAIQEKSSIIDVIEKLKDESSSIYAIVAPAFATQFSYASLGSVVTALKNMGFKDVVEVALGADLVTKHESEELLEKFEQGETLTSSCCPGFVNYIDKKYPELQGYVSHTVSPMIATARIIHNVDPDAQIAFIGPCIAKKTEKEKYNDVDFVLTFEELAALIDATEEDLASLEPSALNNASYYARKFAQAGGVTNAIKAQLGDKLPEGIALHQGNGIREIDKLLKLLKVNRLPVGFIEGMACKGGCIKGPVTMHHGNKDLKDLENYSKQAYENSSNEATRIFSLSNIPLVK